MGHIQGLKQREKASSSHFFLHGSNLYVEELKWIYIEK